MIASVAPKRMGSAINIGKECLSCTMIKLSRKAWLLFDTLAQHVTKMRARLRKRGRAGWIGVNDVNDGFS